MATQVSVIGYGVTATTTATITNGNTTPTAGVDLEGKTLCGVTLDSGFDGTTLGFTVATTLDGTYNTMHNGTADYSKTVAASRYVALNPADFAGVRYIKPVTGSQTGHTHITFHTRVM